jgi:hypothetical protein
MQFPNPPRTRGDQPLRRWRWSRKERPAPHARGSALLERHPHPQTCTRPAHAGISPRSYFAEITERHPPRTRGDQPSTYRTERQPLFERCPAPAGNAWRSVGMLRWSTDLRTTASENAVEGRTARRSIVSAAGVRRLGLRFVSCQELRQRQAPDALHESQFCERHLLSDSCGRLATGSKRHFGVTSSVKHRHLRAGAPGPDASASLAPADRLCGHGAFWSPRYTSPSTYVSTFPAVSFAAK